MTTEEAHALRAWVKRWEATGLELERHRLERLERMTESEARSMTLELLATWSPPEDAVSGGTATCVPGLPCAARG